MKTISESVQAGLLLQTHERGGYQAIPFIRNNAKGYCFFGIYFLILLALVASKGWWDMFGYVAFFIAGMVLRDISWYRAMKRSWPFVAKIIDWNRVKQIAADKP
jgi:hypothetical protein